MSCISHCLSMRPEHWNGIMRYKRPCRGTIFMISVLLAVSMMIIHMTDMFRSFRKICSIILTAYLRRRLSNGTVKIGFMEKQVRKSLNIFKWRLLNLGFLTGRISMMYTILREYVWLEKWPT